MAGELSASRGIQPASVLLGGIVLGNVMVCSSGTFASYAPVPLTPDWLSGASLALGLLLGLLADDTRTAFYSVTLMALVAALVLASMLMVSQLAVGVYIADVLALFALQQSLPRFLMACALGYVGLFLFILLKLIIDRLL